MIDPKDFEQRIKRIDGAYNRREFRDAMRAILEGMEDVGKGFLRIAAAAKIIRDKGYFAEMGFSSFNEFCPAILGKTRKTIYLYLRIQTVIDDYPELFDPVTVTRLGSGKMDKIIVGIKRIERQAKSKIECNRKVKQLVGDIDPTMSVDEVELVVRDVAPPE